MGSPAVRLLKAGAGEPGRAIALCGQPGWRTRIYASPERDAIVRALQSMASRKVAVQLAGKWRPNCLRHQEVLRLWASTLCCTASACAGNPERLVVDLLTGGLASIIVQLSRRQKINHGELDLPAVDTRGEMTAAELVETAASIERERAAEPGS